MAYQQYRPDTTTPPITKNLIILNVLVFLAQLTLDGSIHLTDMISLWPIGTPNFKPYQIVTHMFAHGGFGHILFNMFALWMFGRILENFWGPKKFLIFYLASGLGAAAFHLLVQYLRMSQANQFLQDGDVERAREIYSQLGPALGASGAIMGVLAGFAYLFPNTALYIFLIPIPIKAKWAVLGLVALDLFGGFGNFQGDNVAHFAHLGGALVGFIIVFFWNRTNRKTFY